MELKETSAPPHSHGPAAGATHRPARQVKAAESIQRRQRGQTAVCDTQRPWHAQPGQRRQALQLAQDGGADRLAAHKLQLQRLQPG